MNARGQPLTLHDRLRRVRRRGDDVGSTQCLLPRSHRLATDLLCELLSVRAIATRDADLRELTHPPERLRMCMRLYPGAENGKHAGVLTREQPRRKCGACGRARRGDVRAVHQRDRRPVLLVEQTDQCLMRVAITVPRKERDE